MKNKKKNQPEPQTNSVTQSQAEETLKNKANINDYSRAWEDDR